MKRFFLCSLLVILGAVGAVRADETVRAVQTRLKAGGFYFGEINGKYDSATAAGVTRYQIRNGLQITGKLDQPTRYALGVSASEPKTPMPRFGEDVWRSLRKSDQAAIDKMIAEEDAKKKDKLRPSEVVSNKPPAPKSMKATTATTTSTSSATRSRDERLHDYIAAFVLAGLDPQVGAETEFFADRVNYFGESNVTRDKIRHDLERYNERWPARGFLLAGELVVHEEGNGLNVSFPLRYELRNGSKHATGKVWKTLVLEKTAADDFQIVAVNERKAK
jgi:peptidoglycan hydrolase-like protein with peptidoglycan-binding domain